MPRAQSNGIELEYETFGSFAQPPLVLIMGLSRQMIHWPLEFCERLAKAGHYVIRFDNRDVGLSSKLDHLGPPRVMKAIAALRNGEAYAPPYTLQDMADDTAGLLDALELDAAHVCGVSLGGMIGQVWALRHPERVRSLTSVMSTPCMRRSPHPTPEAQAVLLAPPSKSREDFIEQKARENRVLNGTFPVDEAAVRETAARAYDRCHHPPGAGRQYLAALCAEDRTAALGSLEVPTLVMHGRADPLIPVEHGEATAAAIPDAQLITVEGWGHSLPVPMWPQVIEAVTAHTHQAEAARAATG